MTKPKKIAKAVVVLIENMRFGFAMIDFDKNALASQAVTSWLARVRFLARLALMTCFFPRSEQVFFSRAYCQLHAFSRTLVLVTYLFPRLSLVACIFPRFGAGGISFHALIVSCMLFLSRVMPLACFFPRLSVGNIFFPVLWPVACIFPRTWHR